MAKKSRMTMLKRQRELKKAEKAAKKRAKRQGTQDEFFVEPQPTIRFEDSENTETGPSDA